MFLKAVWNVYSFGQYLCCCSQFGSCTTEVAAGFCWFQCEVVELKPVPGAGWWCVQAGVSGTQDRDKDSQLMNCFVTCSSAFHVGGKIKLDTPNPHCAEGDKSIKQGFEEWSCYWSGDTPVHFSALFLWHLVNKPLNNNPLWWNFRKKYL